MEGKILFEPFQSFELWKGLKRLEWQLEIAPKNEHQSTTNYQLFFLNLHTKKKTAYHVR